MHSTHGPALRRTSIMALSALASLAVSLPISGQVALIRGVVFEDANRNGVRDVTEHGVSSVAVSNQSDVVVTDSSGRFAIAPGLTAKHSRGPTLSFTRPIRISLPRTSTAFGIFAP
jgi:hypothetical protein